MMLTTRKNPAGRMSVIALVLIALLVSMSAFVRPNEAQAQSGWSLDGQVEEPHKTIAVFPRTIPIYLSPEADRSRDIDSLVHDVHRQAGQCVYLPRPFQGDIH